MLAVASRPRSYPVLLPDRSPHPRAPAPRRAKRNPVARALIMALVVFLPAVAYVSQRTEAARSGYTILSLREDVSALREDNARLLAAVTALKSPDRIERIAVHDLGMVAPKQQQLAALTLPLAAVASREIPGPSVWTRLVTWLGLGEAEARETH